MLHDTRARHFDAAAEKVAMEWSQRLLLEAAGKVAAEPVGFKGADAADVLAIPDARPFRAPELEEPEEEESFLAKMNRL
jgi:hypothetical protein